MFASIEPLSGNFLDVYPESAQNLLNALEQTSADGHVHLGPDCFNATVYKRGNDMFQKTPPSAAFQKSGGYRSVAKCDASCSIPIWLCPRANRWYTYGDTTSATKSLDHRHLRMPATDAAWQWCSRSGLDLRRMREDDWLTYSSEHVEAIEAAFQKNENVRLAVGMKTYEIQFVKDGEHTSVYAKQVDVQHPSRMRLVRRAMRHPHEFAVPETAEACALCMEDFADTTHLPWTRTSCNHCFHSVCFERYRISTLELTCPMCRARL